MIAFFLYIYPLRRAILHFLEPARNTMPLIELVYKLLQEMNDSLVEKLLSRPIEPMECQYILFLLRKINLSIFESYDLYDRITSILINQRKIKFIRFEC